MTNDLNDKASIGIETEPQFNIYQAFFILALSLLLTFNKLGQPPSHAFDEAYYIPFAQKYVNGIYFNQSHPPLGKMLVALGQVLYTDERRTDFMDIESIQEDWPEDFDIRGFRIMPALFGSFIPLLVYLTLWRILRQDWLAFFGALLLALDTGFLSIARIGMLDVFLLFFIMLCLFVGVLLIQQKTLARKYWLLVALFAFSAACAANVKDTGLIAGLIYFYVLIDLWQHDQTDQSIWQRIRSHMLPHLALFGGIFLFTYIGLWGVHYAITPNPNTARDFPVSETQQQYLDGEIELSPIKRYSVQIWDGIVYHFNDLTGLPPVDYSANPYEIASPWYFWPFGGRAINFRYETDDGIHYRYSTLIGNPVTWLLSFLGVLFASSAVLTDLFFKFLQPSRERWWLYALTGLYWAYLFPFWFIRRATYIYYYLPTLILGLMMLMLFLHMIQFADRRMLLWLTYALVVACFIAFLIYKPFIYFEPLTHPQFTWRIFWEPWSLRCVGCDLR